MRPTTSAGNRDIGMPGIRVETRNQTFEERVITTRNGAAVSSWKRLRSLDQMNQIAVEIFEENQPVTLILKRLASSLYSSRL